MFLWNYSWETQIAFFEWPPPWNTILEYFGHTIWKRPSILTYFVPSFHEFSLAFCLASTSWHSLWHLFCFYRILSDILSGGYWDLGYLRLAVEVRQCPVKTCARGCGPALPTSSGPRDCGPAVPTQIWSSQLGPSSAHCCLELAGGAGFSADPRLRDWSIVALQPNMLVAHGSKLVTSLVWWWTQTAHSTVPRAGLHAFLVLLERMDHEGILVCSDATCVTKGWARLSKCRIASNTTGHFWHICQKNTRPVLWNWSRTSLVPTGKNPFWQIMVLPWNRRGRQIKLVCWCRSY